MKCVVGISGGVDSAVSLSILRNLGYEVVACTLKMLDTEESVRAIQDSERVADHFGVRHEVVDCVDAFNSEVLDYFVDSYENGRTPNPCVICNREVKFKYLDAFRMKENADMLATGHYARLSVSNDKILMQQAVDLVKDQSYFLYMVDREILLRTLCPLGEYTKWQVRDIARELGIPVASKVDSQDICFIPNGGYADFVCQRSNKCATPGCIVDNHGNVLGEHRGTIHYTIGQRKGLGLSGGPFFVKEIRPHDNSVIVDDKQGVRKDIILLDNVRFINDEFLGDCLVKIRSTNKKTAAKVCKVGQQYYVELYQPEYGVACGQHCVFYNDITVIGGGIIAG